MAHRLMWRVYSYNPAAGGGPGTISDGSVTSAKLGGDVTTAGKSLLTAADAGAQRTALGLGTAATSASTAFAAASHTHAQGDVTGLTTALAGKADTAHTHTIAQVTGLQTALDGKAAAGSFAAATHSHAIADVTNLQTTLDGKAASTHSHALGDVTGLQTALDGKAASSHTHTAAQISDSTSAGRTLLTAADASAQRTALGLGNAALSNASAFQSADNTLSALASLNATPGLIEQTGADTFVKRAIGATNGGDILTRSDADGRYPNIFHNHAATEIISGTIATARLGSGTANSTTFLRGDQTWASASGHFTYIHATADLDRTASTTVTADPTLTITLAATTRYWIEAAILLDVNASADYEFQWTYGGTFTHVTYLDERNVAGAAAGTGTRTARYNTAVPNTALPTTQAVTGTSGGAALITLTMACLTNAGGTFAFAWAPDATGFTCIRRAGSYLRFRAL